MDWTIFLIDLVITAVVYLFLPVLIRLFKGKIDSDSAKVWAIGNAIVICIIFYAINFSYDENSVLQVAPAIFWGVIGYNIMVNKDEGKKEAAKKNTTDVKAPVSYTINTSTTYNENLSLNEKYAYLINMLKKEIGAKDVSDATLKLYNFYDQKGIKIPSSVLVELSEGNEDKKREVLLEVLKAGMHTNNIDDTIKKLDNFYNKRRENNEQ